MRLHNTYIFPYINTKCVLCINTEKVNNMGFRGGYRGYGRGFGRGFGLGYGRGYGRGYYGDPYRCARFPWLPRWWWANPSYTGTYTSPSTGDTTTVPSTPYAVPDERAYLEDQMNYLEQELAAIRKRLEELKSQETV